MTTDPTEAAPRLLLSRSMRGSTGAFARPLPSSLAELAERDELERHANLVSRHAQALEQVRELRAALEAARVDDEREARRAALAGDELPAPKLPELERALDEAERELAQFAAALPASAQTLLDDVAADVGQARENALENGRTVITALLDELEAAERELVRAGAALGEAAWITRLLVEGEAAPFGAAKADVRELRSIAVTLAEVRGRLADVLENASRPPAALETDDAMMWSEAHRVRPRTAQAGGEEQAEPEA